MAIDVGQSIVEAIASVTGGVATSIAGSVTTTASGSSFVIFVRAYAAPTSVTDSKSNVYTLVQSTQNPSESDWLSVYLCVNGTGGATHRPTVTTGVTLNPVILGLIEIVGGATSSATDGSSTVHDTASPFGSPLTTTNANDIVLSLFGGNGTVATVTYTANGSFTLVSAATFTTGTDGLSVGVAKQVVSATAAYDAAWTVSAGSRGPVVTMALKQLAGGGAAVVSNLMLLGVG
jgi:hypothetical protein